MSDQLDAEDATYTTQNKPKRGISMLLSGFKSAIRRMNPM